MCSIKHIRRWTTSWRGGKAGGKAGGEAGGQGEGKVVSSITPELPATITEIRFLLQKLNLINKVFSLGLDEAADTLCRYLNVNLVSIMHFVPSLDPHETHSYVLLAASGMGAQQLKRNPVMTGDEWSAHWVASQYYDHKKMYLFVDTTVAEAEGRKLPRDWEDIHQKYGTTCYLSVPICIDDVMIGALTVAKSHSLDPLIWEPLLGVLSPSLISLLSGKQIACISQLQRVMDSAPDMPSIVESLLFGAHNILMDVADVSVGVRLGIVHPTHSKALIFEEIPKRFTRFEELVVIEVPLAHTLLLDAVSKRKARFVSDCAAYLQSCRKPAGDMFTHPNPVHIVSSIVVLPLVCEQTVLGGLYFTLDVPCNFDNLRNTLVGFVNGVLLVLHKQLTDNIEALWEHSVRNRSIESLTGSSGENVAASMMKASQSKCHTPVALVALDPVDRQPRTEAMFNVLHSHIASTFSNQSDPDDLCINEMIGRGGYGMVHKGTWKGGVAAIKMMYIRQHDRQAMKDAMEMAILMSVRHPNIIQVYTCLTDMVEDVVLLPDCTVKQQRYRKLMPQDAGTLATCNMLVMEFCEMGSMRQAMKRGVFHKRMSNNKVAVDLCSILNVLLEVSYAVSHLHALNMIHCDIKPENVLFKTDSNQLGFVTKLSDFGLTKMLRDSFYIINRSGSGTVTHLAPELFQVGSRITTGVDTYAFGIMMWEAYTGKRAYHSMKRDEIVEHVYRNHQRPAFPSGTPQQYAELATLCWNPDAGNRPDFKDVTKRIKEMLSSFDSGSE